MSAVPALRPPVMGVSRSPLVPMRSSDMRFVLPGQTVARAAPSVHGMLVARINGDWLLRADWPLVTLGPGDVLEFYELPQDKDALRSIVQIAALVVSLIPGFQWVGFFIGVAGSILLAPSQIQPPERKAATLYSTSLSGNQAVLDEPIWKTLGRRRITPPFAGNMYFRFQSKPDPDNTGDNSDQIVYAIYAVGHGDHDLERELFGDTTLASFRDIQVRQYLPPGVQPSVALANVTTVKEVSNLSLDSGKFAGGFSGCAPRRKVWKIGIDIVAPRGLGKLDSALTVTWRVYIREINDFGVPLSPYSILVTETRTANTNTPQRWSTEYELSAPYRPEVQVVRIDPKDTSASALHDLQWVQMRSYLSNPAPLNPHTAHYELVMRSSEQLSNQALTDFSLIVIGHSRPWHPDTGWGAYEPTRNFAWHVLDALTDPVWGYGYPDARIDLQSFYEYSLTAAARQDRCDYTFTESMDGWEALQLLAATGRCRVFWHNGLISIARDEWLDLPVTAFTPRNTVPGSMKLSEGLAQPDTFDGVILEFEDNRTWKWTPIWCPCPGYSAPAESDLMYDPALPPMENPQRIRIPGITGEKHALREGLMRAAAMRYRRTPVRCTTEMQGMLPTFMSPVRYMPELVGYGQSGDVAFWDAETLEISLSEPPDWDDAPLYLTLFRDDATLTTPVKVTPGSDEWSVRLPAAPDFELILDDGTRERPKYMLGSLNSSDELVRIKKIGDGGKSDKGVQLFDIEALVDDVRVHTYDNRWLPALGEVQDDIDSTPIAGEGGTLALVTLEGHWIQSGDSVTGGGDNITVTLFNDGTMSYARAGLLYPDDPIVLDHEWLLVPVEVDQAAGFEVYASCDSPGADFVGSAMNTWLSLGTTQSWEFGNIDRVAVGLRLQIREAATGVVQADRTLYLTIAGPDLGTGG